MKTEFKHSLLNLKQLTVRMSEVNKNRDYAAIDRAPEQQNAYRLATFDHDAKPVLSDVEATTPRSGLKR